MRCLLVLLIFILSSAVSHAALSIVINIESKTLKIEGEDSGTGANYYSVEDDSVSIGVLWLNQDMSDSYRSLDVKNAFSEVISSARLYVYDDGGIALRLFSSDDDLSTLHGNGNEISYAALDTPYLGILESSNGLSLSLDEGIIYSSVQMTVVPEPLHYTTIAGLFALCGILGVRHQRRHLS